LCVEVHHIRHRADGGSDAVGNLITLCPNHHAMVHRNLIPAGQLTKAIARRRSTGQMRAAEAGEFMEYVARACAGADMNDPLQVAKLKARLSVELPEMLEVIFGAEVVSASLDSFRALLRDAF
jgi:hypothetical protein